MVSIFTDFFPFLMPQTPTIYHFTNFKVAMISMLLLTPFPSAIFIMGYIVNIQNANS